MASASMRSAGLLFGVLALAVGGCGTLSGGVKSESALLATASLPPTIAAPPAYESAVGAPEPVAAAVAAEARVPTGAAVQPSAAEVAADEATLAFAPVSFEPIKPEDRPSYMVAFLGPPVISQRGTPGPPPDVTIEEYDPWEPYNEKMFSFNYNLDKYVIKPVAKAYNFVMPDLFQQMISNGFDNINLAPKVVNNLLQLRLKGATVELGRFLINSTLGIGGLFDIARQEFGLEKTKVDFGQTLGRWGTGPGPYLILPFLPPFTVRDAIGYGVDGAMDPLSYYLPFFWDRLGMKVGDVVNDRALNLDLFQGFEETTVDLYTAVRNGYLQRRHSLIKGP